MIMAQKKIKVMFFSKVSTLSQEMASLLEKEVDFDSRKLENLFDINNLNHDELDAIFIVDLSDSAVDFESFIDSSEVKFLSLPFIFVINNEKLRHFFSRKNFSRYKTIFKPVLVEELFSAIRTLATKFRKVDERIILLRGNFFDPRKNEIRKVKGNSVRLTEKETELINFLYKRRGKIISKKILLQGIWGYKETISTHTLETHIYRLRKKLELDLGEKDLIMKNNTGYYLNMLYPTKSSQRAKVNET